MIIPCTIPLPRYFKCPIAYNLLMTLTNVQLDLIENLSQQKIFLRGLFGTGKTTAAIHLLNSWMDEKELNKAIIVLAPQRIQHLPYINSLYQNPKYHGLPVSFLTMHGLARRMLTLYWPLIKDFAGFKNPYQPPHYLTMESAQYFMAHLVSPLIDQGYFSSLTMDRNRIYSQLLDNLNKSAIAGFSFQTIGERLSNSWIGDSSQLNVYDNVQESINQFRSFCLENSLLDYSLQIELFQKFIWPSQLFKNKLFSMFDRMIYENCEEDPPFVHELVAEWLPQMDSAILIFDENAGYRHFLGASPTTAESLTKICNQEITFTDSFVNLPATRYLIQKFCHPTSSPKEIIVEKQITLRAINEILITPEDELRYYPQMLEWTINQIKLLITSGTPSGEIAILSPYLSDMLRFEIESRLEDLNISYQSYRPSRALRDEPAIQSLLTLIKLKYPEWQFVITKISLSNALSAMIQDLDPIRARLIANQQESPDDHRINQLLPFADFPESIRARVTYRLGARYEQLREWLTAADGSEPLDMFISRIFGELLTQPGFTFEKDVRMGKLTANLIESIHKFRLAMEGSNLEINGSLSREYIKMVSEGVIAAQYIHDWDQDQITSAVYISPAYSFLLQNRAVDYQFWLDINSNGWYARLLQPLTHPYVLSQDWQVDEKWDAEDEMRISQENIERVISGLLSRCKKSVYLGISNLNQSGADERGLLTRKLFEILRQATKAGEHA